MLEAWPWRPFKLARETLIELEMVLSRDEERWPSGTCNECGTGELKAGDARPPGVPADRMDIAEAARCCLCGLRTVWLLWEE